jgi:hypothetical protein
MTKHSNNTNTSQDTSRTSNFCSAPQVSAKVSDYIFDLLDDAVAFEVEKHLAGCNHCKEKYLTVLRVRAEAMEKPEIETGNDPVETNDQKDPETLVGVKD